MRYVIVLAFLLVCSLWDVKYRKIPVFVYVSFLLISLIVVYKTKGFDLRCILVGVLPGVCVLFMSFVTHEKIGYGDAMAIILLGLVYDLGEVVSVCIAGFYSAFLVCVLMLIVGKVKVGDRIAFVPFLTIGNIMSILTGVI